MTPWTDPYSADGYVWIMKPRKVFEARVNLASASYPRAEIPYDGVTTGSIADVEMGMTVTLGSTAGGYDLGIHYVRGSESNYAVGDSDTLQVGYHSQGRRRGELDVVNDAYITVWDHFDVWKRAAKSDPTNGAIYKDYALLNDPTHLQPVANLGGGIGEAGFVASGMLAVDLDSSGSQIAAADLPAPTWFATAWDVKDGAITVGTDSDDAITAEFPAGYRWVKLLKEDTNGRTSLPRRYCVAALETSGANAPLTTVHKVSWSLKPDGVTLQADLRERIDPAEYLPFTVVMLLIDDELGGFKTKFAGYLDHWQSFSSSTLTGTEIGTTLFAVDVLGRAKQIQGFPSVQARAPLPSGPNEMPGATLSRYVWWVWLYHTSIPMVADIDLNLERGDLYPFSRFASPGGSFFAIGDNLAKAMACDLTGDSRGRLALVADPMRQEVADRTDVVQRDITEGDWTRLERVKHPFPAVGLLKGSALPASTTNAADLTTALAEWFAVASGTVDGQGLSSDTVGYPQIARSEVELWRRLGHDLARRNATEDLIRATLAHGGDAGIEPAKRQWVTLTVSEENVGWLDETLDEARCLPVQVDFVYEDAIGSVTQSVVLERETVGTVAVRDPHPEPGTSTVISAPTGLTPMVQALPPLLRAGVNDLIFANGDGYMYLCADFQTSPVYSRYSLATLGMTGTLQAFNVEAHSPAYLGTGTQVAGMIVTTTKAWFIEDCFDAPSLSNEHALPATALSVSMQASRIADGVYVIASHPDDGRVNSDVTTDRGATWQTETNIGGIYVGGAGDNDAPGAFASEHAAHKFLIGTFTGTGSTVTSRLKVSTDDGDNYADLDSNTTFALPRAIHIPYGVADDSVIYWGGADNTPGHHRYHLMKTVSGTVSDISPTSGGETYGPVTTFAIKTCDSDPNSVLLIGRNIDSGGTVKIGVFLSRNGGSSWTEVVAPGSSVVWRAGNFADNANTFFLLGGGAVGYSSDGGATIIDKSGNLGADFPSAGNFLNLAGRG